MVPVTGPCFGGRFIAPLTCAARPDTSTSAASVATRLFPVVAIFTFVGMWGNFFVPFVLLLSPDKLPASVSIYTFFSQYGQVAYGQLAAYSLLYSGPVVILFLFLSRKLGGAFAFGGAVKG